jgi:Pentapeptide repeats (8 copies)
VAQVLRLNDTDVRPAHRGEFRVLVAARRTGLGQVRVYLAADILRRLSERSRLAPTVIDLAPDGEDDLRAICAELNIHPPGHTLTPPASADQLAGLFPNGIREPLFDVGVRAEPGEPAVDRLARHWIYVPDAADATDSVTASTLRERLGVGEEPLSVRMKLMRHGYGEAVGNGEDLGGASLDGASLDGASLDGASLDGASLDGEVATLARWRELVARWARSPSGPMSRRYADAVTAAFESGLDTAAALREMDALAADPGEPDGVKFETFAAADMLLGLDLARDIGR